jgi:cAMP-dependent protein kinase regulator
MRAGHRQTVTEQYRKRIQASEEVCLATFAGADKPEVSQALHEGKYQDFAAGAVIIKQGDPADAFYVLVSGKVEVIRTNSRGQQEDPIPLGAGAYFGEIGLLHNVPRTATVRVTSTGPATTLVLSAEAFRKIIAASDMISEEIASVMRKRTTSNQLHQLVRQSTILQLGSMLHGFSPTRFSAGQTIICEGDPADAFYILYRGEALVSHPGKNGPEHVATLHPGDYFGETGLLHNTPRNATVTAGISEVVVLKCNRETFNELVSSPDGKLDLAQALTRKLQKSP